MDEEKIKELAKRARRIESHRLQIRLQLKNMRSGEDSYSSLAAYKSYSKVEGDLHELDRELVQIGADLCDAGYPTDVWINLWDLVGSRCSIKVIRQVDMGEAGDSIGYTVMVLA